jgi:hypothetical protein
VTSGFCPQQSSTDNYVDLFLFGLIFVFNFCDKYLRGTMKRKGLFWLMVSEVSVHGPLTPLLEARGEANIMATRSCSKTDCLCHGDWEAERR